LDNFTVAIWENQTKGKEYDHPAFTFRNIVAENAEMALRKVLWDNNIHFAFHVEVTWNNGIKRQEFNNYSL
jgi:hypothetical protein